MNEPVEQYDQALDALTTERSWGDFFHSTPFYLFSIALHLLIMILLVRIYLPNAFQTTTTETIAQPGLGDLDKIDILGDPIIAEVNIDTDQTEVNRTSVVSTETDVSRFHDETSAELSRSQWSDSLSEAFSIDSVLTNTGSMLANDLSGRGSMKGMLVSQGGGSEGSEKAVALGLSWIAEHQNPDGSWRYDFTTCPKCRGQCGNPGRNRSANSSTAFALLPFLGSGITHKQGKREYQKVVDGGLKFILSNAKQTPEGLSFIDVKDGQAMYHHGITSIAICEAAAMSQDPQLLAAAQQAVNFIAHAQIPSDGGWRYQPRDSSGGDTSVVGWQVMALKSAAIGGANVPPDTLSKTRRFLNNVVAAEGGAKYGYASNRMDGEGLGRDIRATTSIGLLCQMYMGWRPDNPALIRGVNYISDEGPDAGNMYYNYYATQVMHHYGGEQWDKWNRKLRDALVAEQITEGHERGSWYHTGDWNDTGGRLYTTSMAVMILEVYYRHLPLFKANATREEFPLD